MFVCQNHTNGFYNMSLKSLLHTSLAGWTEFLVFCSCMQSLLMDEFFIKLQNRALKVRVINLSWKKNNYSSLSLCQAGKQVSLSVIRVSPRQCEVVCPSFLLPAEKSVRGHYKELLHWFDMSMQHPHIHRLYSMCRHMEPAKYIKIYLTEQSMCFCFSSGHGGLLWICGSFSMSKKAIKM